MTWHVLPVNDLIEHDVDEDCLCGPDIEFTDPETGETYSDGPVMVHHSLDGREMEESE